MDTLANSNNLIPRQVIFGNPDKANVQISKDGNFISYLSSKDGALNIFVAKANDLKSAKTITNDTKRGIRNYFWSHDNKHILYLQDTDGDENDKIHKVDVETLNNTILTPKNGVKAQINHVSYKSPNEIIIGLNERRKDYFDIYKLNISTSESSLLYKNDKYSGFNIDDDNKIRFGYFMTPDAGNQIYQFKGQEEVPFIKIEQDDLLTSGIEGFNQSGDKAYFIDSSGRDTSALYMLDLETKEKELLYANTKADVEGLIIHPKSKILQAVSSNYEKQEYKIFDDELKDDYSKLKELHKDGQLIINSRTLNDDKWIVVFTFDDKPAMYYLYDKTSKEAQYLFTNKEKLQNYTLSNMHPVIIKSRDGLNLVSYLSVPVDNAVSSNSYKTKQPIPMVLYVHGGPNARDVWGLDSIHQWLTNRGYAVLSMNYRGSTGFGKNFINKGNGQWAGKMHDDLIDGVNWAIEEGVADKDKIAIMGGSYGGYATLVGLTFTPDTFACGVDIVGPSNLLTLINSLPEYWKPFIENMKLKLGGDHQTEEGREILKAKSPLFYADRIKKPLLIGQGANDPRVKQAESDQIVNKLKSHNIPVIYALYPDEGHGFARPENRLSFFAIAEGFFAKYLGGRYEPIKNDFDNSSIKIEAGKEHLPHDIR
jgi:dipeptidyl aminopeptidase/acylaminoacyl peptidase